MEEYNDRIKSSKKTQRPNVMNYSQSDFARLVINDMSSSRQGKSALKKYKQSEVSEILEGYKLPRNQEKLVEISQLLFAKSPHYKRLIQYFGGMALFAHIITPIKDIRKLDQDKVLKQYLDIGEMLKVMSLKHEMRKVMSTAFIEDVFFGYVHKSENDFYIQKINSSMARITSVEDGVYNYSIDMSYFQNNEDTLHTWASEIQMKYRRWSSIRSKNPRISSWVELDAENTICIKINEEIIETFPPFAGSFDSIFDIEGFKRLRKDREEIGNYMILAQELPMRKDSENNNDFMIDRDMFTYFHNMASDVAPENIGVITSPMKIEPIKFDKDRADNDGVAKAERDFWGGNGTSQLLFNADKSTSQGLLMSIKTDEEIVFGVLEQIERWLNRYLKHKFKNLMFSVDILDVTYFNRKEMYEMYLKVGQYGVPVKNKLSATVGLDPIETVNMVYLENDVLKFHESFIPLASSHTMSGDDISSKSTGRPAKEDDEISDEASRSKDKPNA